MHIQCKILTIYSSNTYKCIHLIKLFKQASALFFSTTDFGIKFSATSAGVMKLKRLSSKINYDALNSIFDDEPSEKKSRIDDGDAKGEESGNVKSETKDAVDGEEEEDLEYDDDDETQGDEWIYNNEHEMDGYYEEEEY
nr:transcription factor IIIB 60 kDa subunit-like isoform X1 [Tanacetum cinerariifolium]